MIVAFVSLLDNKKSPVVARHLSVHTLNHGNQHTFQRNPCLLNLDSHSFDVGFSLCIVGLALCTRVLDDGLFGYQGLDAFLRVHGYDPSIPSGSSWITVCACRLRTCVKITARPVSYTHLRAHETDSYLVCRLLLEK